jgi:hypothetical protein
MENENSFDWGNLYIDTSINIDEDCFNNNNRDYETIEYDNINEINQSTSNSQLITSSSSPNNSFYSQVIRKPVNKTFKHTFYPANNYTFIKGHNKNKYYMNDETYEGGVKLNCHLNALSNIECDNTICYLDYNMCMNRRIQKQEFWNTCIIAATLNGTGNQLICNCYDGLKSDIIIGEYTGKVIHHYQMIDIIRKGGKNIFIMELFSNKSKETDNLYLDARGIHGNNCFFINHSCDPNVIFEKWIIEGETRIAVRTIKEINFQESITVNYNITVNNSVSKTELMKCKCGSNVCKETIQQIKKSKKK